MNKLSLLLVSATVIVPVSCSTSQEGPTSGSGASLSTTGDTVSTGSAGTTGSTGSSMSNTGGGVPMNPSCNGSVHSTAAPGIEPQPIALKVPTGFTLTPIAEVPAARQLAALPNGDLLVATNSDALYLIPNADAADAPGSPVAFAMPSESNAQGLSFDPGACVIYLSSQHDIYAIAYKDGQMSGDAGMPIAHVRTGTISPNRPPGDTDDHTSTSVAFVGGTLYAGAGSSCNACVESDPTRAAIQRMDPNGANMVVRATRFRNAIAITGNPNTGTLWAGGAGQDALAEGHPYEFFDAVSLHSGVADYGWPECEENHMTYASGASCGGTVAPLVEMPAYSTIIGATFYPANASGPHAFPAMYRGGLFLAAHGSWHKTASGAYASAPQIVFVPMNGDQPQIAVDWSDPTKQWTQFVGGFQGTNGTSRIGRPTGLAVGALGSLFFADDQNGYVFRVRPM